MVVLIPVNRPRNGGILLGGGVENIATAVITTIQTGPRGSAEQ